MAKYLLLLSLSLLLIRSNDVFAQNNACYCTTPYIPNATFGSVCTANPECWACQQGAYSVTWQQAFCPGVYQAPQACNQEVEFQTQSCPANYSGIITQSRTKTCPENVWQAWTTTQNTCTPNPPTCQTSQQTQSLSCQTGYTGSITQTQTSSCPNPYGSPVWSGVWVTTSTTCAKSLSNPTNLSSPASPLSPVNPSSIVNSPTTTPTTGQQENPQSSGQTGLSAQTLTGIGIATNEAAQSDANQKASEKQESSSPSIGVKIPSLGRALSLELIVKPMLKQPVMFVEPQIVQGLPNDVLFNNQLLLDIYGGSLPDQSNKFKQIAADAVELEQ